MISENIKTILGEELAGQVEEAVKGKGKDGKDLDLVVGNDGSFVPADKYDGEKRRSASAESALKAAADALKAVGGSGDPEKLEADVAAAKGVVDALKADHKRELETIQKTTAVRLALAGEAHDPTDILALLDLEKVQVGGDGVVKIDLEELVKPIRDTKPYLFREKKEPEAPPLSGAKPGEPGGSKPPAKAVDQMTYTELAAYMAANPGAQL